MRFRAAIFIAISLLTSSLAFVPSAGAVDVIPFDPSVVKTDSPVIITGYSFQGPRVNYVQLFNTSDEAIDLTGWQLEYKVTGQVVPVVLASLGGLLKPSNYVLAADDSVIPSADFTYSLAIPVGVTANATSISLQPSASYLTHTVTLGFDSHSNYWKRNVSTSTGNYLSTFAYFIPPVPLTLYGGGLYEYPAETGLQVSEILANPKNCSPLDTALDCRDYVKLYNPTDQPIDLALFRLRSGYQGQSATAGNTYALGGTVAPGHFAVMTTSSDNRPLSITNSGGFIWLEDTYGIKRYDLTVQEYPDASADSKNGQAWAYDVGDGVWKWTTQPTPIDGPSVFPVAPIKATASVSSVLTPCREDQYRSEETNRCRSLASLVSTTLAVCAPDQERNPETNRCRKTASAANELTPCKEGQERHPDTNRCRNVAGVLGDADFAVETVADTGKAFVGWWALGGIGTLAIGRGIWEWRSEMLSGIRKVGSFFTSGK